MIGLRFCSVLFFAAFIPGAYASSIKMDCVNDYKKNPDFVLRAVLIQDPDPAEGFYVVVNIGGEEPYRVYVKEDETTARSSDGKTMTWSTDGFSLQYFNTPTTDLIYIGALSDYTIQSGYTIPMFCKRWRN